MIYKETFAQLFNLLAGENVRVSRREYDARRLRRALFALKVQNYFLNLQFTNASGAAAVQGVSITKPLRQRLIIRGGGMNSRTPQIDALVGTCDIQLYRSAQSRPQLSKEFICDGHYISGGQGQGQKWELDWPVPLVLDPNEVVRATFKQASATTAGTVYNLGLYGVTVDNSFRCENTLLEDFKEQICKTLQRPFYLNMKNDKGAGTLTFPAIAANQRIVANTDEADEHLLVLGFRRNSSNFLNGSLRFLVTGDYSLSRSEIPVNAFEFYNSETDGYFRFSVPYLLQKGASIGAAVTQTPTTVRNQFEGEINLLCVTV